MENGQSVADMFIEAGLKPVETNVEPVKPIDNNLPSEVVIPINTDTNGSQNNQNQDNQQQNNQNQNQDDNDYDDGREMYLHFATQLGFEIDSNSLEQREYQMVDLINLAKQAIEHETKPYEIFATNDVVKEFAEHLNAGGTIDSFKQLQQKQTFYQNYQLPDNNIEVAEQIIKNSLSLKGVDESMVDILIENMKDNGKIFDFAKNELSYLQKNESEQNQSIEEKVRQSIENERNDVIEYFKNLNEALLTNNFDGFSLPANELDIIKQLSLPDKDGVIGIDEIGEDLTSNQIALVNYAAYKIAKGENFNISFNKNKANMSTRPIAKIGSSNNGNPNYGNGKNKQLSLDEFVNIIATS